MTKAVLFLAVAFFLHLQCQGLEMTLNRDVLHSTHTRTACGVLVCVEESRTVNTTSTNSGQNENSPSFSTISSLTVFRIYPATSKVKSSEGRRILIAAVSTQQPNMIRVSNGVKVNGSLTGERASIRLELVKQADCRAEFTCQVSGMDTKGKEFVSTSHLLQQPRDQGDGGNTDLGVNDSLEPDMVVQLLGLVRQLSTRLSTPNWGDSFKRVEHGQERSDDKMVHLEDKIDRLANKLDVFNLGLRDEMKSLENRLEDKLEHLTQGVLRNPENTNRLFSEKMAQFDTLIQRSFERMSQNATKIHTNTSRVLLKLENEIGDIKRNGQTSLKNFENGVKATFHNFTQDMDRKLGNEWTVMKDSLERVLRDSSIKFDSSAEKTSLLLDQLVTEDSTRNRGALQTIMSGVLRPSICEEGMAPALPQISFGYAVVYPNRSGVLTSPYLCDTFTDGGGWTVIQRRVSGKVDFYRNWASYKKGFGSLADDFWLGNDNIHKITNSGTYELRVDLQYKGKSTFANYKYFSLGDEHSNYRLNLGAYIGTAGDSLSSLNGKAFSTHDKDNDSWPKNCAVEYKGAWWYGACHSSNLNGKWGSGKNKGPRWDEFSGDNAVSFSEMKIRIAK